ncbi:MAG: nuclear transport factor 2 family protein, partial [Candidatus Eremiobacteraeota bacterium]|nr:nuclear transport factor 2 family protein [Candidatus Eremiobacteraeota bacterium]
MRYRPCMKKRLILASFALALSGSLGSATLPAAAAQDAQAAIQAAYDAQCTAIKAGDVDEAAKSIADDFSGVDPDGKKEDRAKTIASMKSGLAQAKISACANKILKFDQKGDHAVLALESSVDGMVQGPTPAPLRV